MDAFYAISFGSSTSYLTFFYIQGHDPLDRRVLWFKALGKERDWDWDVWLGPAKVGQSMPLCMVGTRVRIWALGSGSMTPADLPVIWAVIQIFQPRLADHIQIFQF